MTSWQTLPTQMPTDGSEVWVRLDQWFGKPFLAYWTEADQNFYDGVNRLYFPWWRVARWRYP
jgi:hypothetical protein